MELDGPAVSSLRRAIVEAYLPHVNVVAAIGRATGPLRVSQ
jgi:hypothetical protein